VNTDSKTVPESSAAQGSKSVGPTKKQAVGAASKATRPAKATTNSPRSARSTSSTEKLVCRYCGSDDLAPSFQKRRDARCRACFKKRYASAPKSEKTTRPRKTKAAN
jgi:hypothetical protein